MLEQAHRRAEQILGTHRAAVPEEIVRDLHRFVERNAGRTEWS